jgi:hypothetical protein
MSADDFLAPFEELAFGITAFSSEVKALRCRDQTTRGGIVKRLFSSRHPVRSSVGFMECI